MNLRSAVSASMIGLSIAACATSADDSESVSPEVSSSANCPTGKFDINRDESDGCEYECTPSGSDDPIDADYKDDNCDGSDGVVARCLFVSQSGADTAGRGSREAPFQTLAYALLRAKEQGKDVCLAAERFTGPIVLSAGTSVYGGFNANASGFAFRRDPNTATTLTATGNAILASAIDHETHVEGLTIEVAPAADALPGSSVSAVKMLGGSATLYVRYNVLRTPPGRAGALGESGGVGSTGTNGNPGIVGCDGCGSPIGLNGGSQGGTSPQSACGGAPGGVGGQGGYDQTGGAPGGNGTGNNSRGGAGGSGGATCAISSGGGGQPGGTPTDVGTEGEGGEAAIAHGSFAADGTYIATIGGEGTAGNAGNAGGGGGGGGGGSNGGLCNGDRGGGGGSGGTGGCGGLPGKGGHGGGGSFGVIAVKGHAVIGGNRIEVATGGKGGDGGDGGEGGAGGHGANGGGNGGDEAGPGGRGGDGSRGGRGGRGGGGAGGPSICIAMVQGANVEQKPTNRCTTAIGGQGGNVNASNAGARGESSELVTFTFATTNP